MIKKKLTDRKTILFLLSLAALTLTFNNNLFQTVQPSWFSSFQIKGESLVPGRLLRSEKNGLLSQAGLLGWNHPPLENAAPPEDRFKGWGYSAPVPSNKFVFQYDALEKDLEVDHYELYYSQSGGQAFVYGVTGKLLHLSGDSLVAFCRFLNAFFTALVFSLFVWWVAQYFGLFPAAFTLALLLVFHRPIVYAKNMLYVTGLFYLPFITMLLYMHYSLRSNTYHYGKALALVFVSVLLKCVLAGFDFMTPTLVMAVLPWFFYSIDQQWKTRQWLARITTGSLVALAAGLFGVLILTVQIAIAKGSWGAAVDYIIFTGERRAYGNANELADIYASTHRISVLAIFTRYLKGYAIDFDHIYEGILAGLRIKFNFFFNVFVAASFFALFLKNLPKTRVNALLITTWVSLAGPLSWFIFFKNHAITHTIMNQVIWHMPFMFLGCVLTGYVLKGLFLSARVTIKSRFLVKPAHDEPGTVL
jgi:hypothetical protein